MGERPIYLILDCDSALPIEAVKQGAARLAIALHFTLPDLINEF
jgi:hypothetical protein